jgi:hypothetical protein
MKQLSGVRKASAAAGDDLTLTRWVKTGSRHSTGRKPAPASPDATGTRFPTRVLRVDQMPRLLVPGMDNVKIGRDVRKGKHRGYRIFTLSLEERKTCPWTCQHWTTCYGNAMPFAKRIDHTDPAFLPALMNEVDMLVKKHKGVLIRLHALGDFFDQRYVIFWQNLCVSHPTLAIFGYTAHLPGSPIGDEIALGHELFGDQWMIRFSNGAMSKMSTASIKHADEKPGDAFLCPEQTGQTRCCATCGLCWSTEKNVAFQEH